MATPELRFSVVGADFDRFAATPLIVLQLRIAAAAAQPPIRNVMLQCQVRVEPSRRHYQAAEQARLGELFGEPERWNRTLHSLLWTQATVLAPPFYGACTVPVPLPCSFDFNVAMTKYLQGLDAGEVPLLLLFSGSVFYAADAGLQIGQIPWHQELRHALPLAVWRSMMAHHYPDSAWLRLSHGVYERLRAYRQSQRLADWEQAVDQLLRIAAAAPGGAADDIDHAAGVAGREAA